MRLSDHLHQLTFHFEVSTPAGPAPRFVNAFLVDHGDGVTVIDAGVRGSSPALLAYLGELGRRPEEVRQLLLTHAHPDHLGGAASLCRACGCRVSIAAAERGWAEDVARQQRERPVPGFDALVEGSVKVDGELADGERLSLGSTALEVLAVPGHSPGSCAFHLPDEGTLITGDALPVPKDMPIYDDYLEVVASVERLEKVPGVELLVESWRAPETTPSRRFAQAKAWLEEVDAAVRGARAQRGPVAPLELARAVVERLGLPAFAANPLVARSLASHPA